MTTRDPIEAAKQAVKHVAVTHESGWHNRAYLALGQDDWRGDDPADAIARAAIATYLRARAELADKGPIGEWPRMLRALADEVERHSP